MRQLPIAVALFGFGFLGTCAKATTIDFEAQGASAPSSFTGHTDSPLTIGSAVFTGGQLLRNAAGGADSTAIYGTTNIVAGAYTDPITITFSQSINNFSVLITNEFPDTYSVTDDKGISTSAFVNGNTGQIFSLTGSGITKVTISSSLNAHWDFAIDNVSFTAAAAVPEPAMFLPVLGVLIVMNWRRGSRPGIHCGTCRGDQIA